MDVASHERFRKQVWEYYAKNKRTFPWRETTDPYEILVSELMLQQTQTDRVVPKYKRFLKRFPTLDALSKASQVEVLSYWQGLGYNRRALYLHQTSIQIVDAYGGKLPADEKELQKLPGIGPYTAAAICAFAFNQPTTVIETNIRTVFIFTFFKDQDAVYDKDILPIISQTVDQSNPRDWYYALMDYGVYIKKMYPNPSRKSKHHTKQSRFEGSDRQIRGAIVRKLLDRQSISYNTLVKDYKDAQRVDTILNKLAQEGFIVHDAKTIQLQQ